MGRQILGRKEGVYCRIQASGRVELLPEWSKEAYVYLDDIARADTMSPSKDYGNVFTVDPLAAWVGSLCVRGLRATRY